jgi:hypothetical protein
MVREKEKDIMGEREVVIWNEIESEKGTTTENNDSDLTKCIMMRVIDITMLLLLSTDREQAITMIRMIR